MSQVFSNGFHVVNECKIQRKREAVFSFCGYTGTLRFYYYFYFYITKVTYRATAWMIYYALQSQRGSLLLREGNKHFSSPVRSVAGCGPAHALWAFLSWGGTADCAWWHCPTPQGSLLRKAALRSPEAPGLGIRLEFRAQLYDLGGLHRTFLSLSLLQQASCPRWPW